MTAGRGRRAGSADMGGSLVVGPVIGALPECSICVAYAMGPDRTGRGGHGAR
jgi:hypothetical protein